MSKIGDKSNEWELKKGVGLDLPDDSEKNESKK